MNSYKHLHIKVNTYASIMKTNKKKKFLDTFGTNLTEKAKNNQLDMIIGREKEIQSKQYEIERLALLSKEKEQLPLSIPFTKIIEIVRIAISWRSLFIKNERQETEESLFSLALFRCATGSLPFNNKKLLFILFITLIWLYKS